MANTNAVVSTRSYGVFYKAFNTANALPADTVLYGTTPPGFTDAGYTSGGLTFGVDETRNDINVDQEFFPVVSPITKVNVKLSTQLAEMTPANIQLATGIGSLTSLAAATGVRGHDDLAITSTFTSSYNTVAARVQAPDNEIFEIYLWRAIATGSVSAAFTPDNAATIAVEWTGLVDSSTSPGRIATVRDVSPAA